MKRSVFAFAFAAAATLAATVAPAPAQVHPPGPIIYHHNHVDVDNQTADAWVWVTAYRSGTFGRKILRAWCVAPREFKKEVITTVLPTEVADARLEVTKKNCAHPVMIDREWNYIYKTFVLTGSGGKYEISLRDKPKLRGTKT